MAAQSVKIQLKAVGSAPLLTKTKFKVGKDETVGSISEFLARALALGPEAPPLFIYAKDSIPLCAEESLAALFRSFATGEELVLSYGLVASYG